MIGDILQPTHLLFILVIALLVLGPKRLPEVARSLGRGLRDFKNALNPDEIREQMISSTPVQTTTPTEQEPTVASETPLSPEPGIAPTETADSDQPSSPTKTSAEPEAAVSAPAPDHTAEPEAAVSAPAPDHTV